MIQKQNAVNSAALAKKLDDLSTVQYKELVLSVIEQSPEVLGHITRKIESMGVVATNSRIEKSQERKSSADLKTIKRAVEKAFQKIKYRLYGENLGQSELQEVIDKVSKELHLYDPYDRLIILQALNKVYLDEIKYICRSGGYSEDGIFFEDLDEVWCDAILQADLSEVEAIKFKSYLEKWLPEANEVDIEVDSKMSLLALDEGWHTPHIKRVLSGGYSSRRETPDEIASAVSKVRLVILEQQNRYVEYKQLARYENFSSEVSYIET